MSRIVVAIILLTSTPAFAKDKKGEPKKLPVTIELAKDIYTVRFVRGFVFSQRPVIQPSINVTWKGLTLMLCGNFNTEHAHWNEIDVVLDYTLKEGPWSLSAGYGYFRIFHNDAFDYTQEIYAAVAFNKFVNIKLLSLYDFAAGSGFYTELSVSKAFKLTKRISIVPKVALGHNHEYLREGSGFSHVQAMLSMPIKACSKFTVVPLIAYSEGFAEEFQSKFYFGVNLKFSI